MFKTKDSIAKSIKTTLLELLPIGETGRKIIGKLLEPENLKRIAIVGVVGSVVVGLISRFLRNSMLRMEIRGELKKQLEPVYEKLEELEEQNAELLRQNEALQGSLEELANV